MTDQRPRVRASGTPRYEAAWVTTSEADELRSSIQLLDELVEELLSRMSVFERALEAVIGDLDGIFEAVGGIEPQPEDNDDDRPLVGYPTGRPIELKPDSPGPDKPAQEVGSEPHKGEGSSV